MLAFEVASLSNGREELAWLKLGTATSHLPISVVSRRDIINRSVTC